MLLFFNDVNRKTVYRYDRPVPRRVELGFSRWPPKTFSHGGRERLGCGLLIWRNICLLT